MNFSETDKACSRDLGSFSKCSKSVFYGMNEKVVYLREPLLTLESESAKGASPLPQSNKVAAVQNAKKAADTKVVKKTAALPGKMVEDQTKKTAAASKKVAVSKKAIAVSKTKKN